VRVPPTALAQVDTVFPDEGTLSVVFPHLAMLSGIRVKVSGQGLSARTGRFKLPRRGDWGIVAFYQDDPRSCVWLITLPDDVWNALPSEIFKADPLAGVAYGEDGSHEIHYSNGDRETRYGDGTLLRLTHSKDGTPGNAGGRVRLTPRKVTEPQGADHEATRVGYVAEPLAPVDVVLQHSSGAVLIVTADGSVNVQTARGHRFSLHDGTEKTRSVSAPLTVTGTPEEDAQRVSSEIYVQTEQGHRITLHDDPVRAQDRYVSVTTAGGHRLELRDKPTATAGVSVTTAGGLSVVLLDAARTATVTAETVIVAASVVKLGSAAASKLVLLDGDFGPDAQGGTVPIASSASKVFAE
jgi:hypothetical protein